MEKIGQRITVNKSKEKVEIAISAFGERSKNNLLLLWLLAFTVCGIVVLLELFKPQSGETKIYLFVFMGFWLYFELKILKAWRWRTMGVEKITITPEKVGIVRETAGKGIEEFFNREGISDFKKVEKKDKERSFAETMNNSYWVIAGESLAFVYNGKEVRFGLQLDEKETSALYKLIGQQFR